MPIHPDEDPFAPATLLKELSLWKDRMHEGSVEISLADRKSLEVTLTAAMHYLESYFKSDGSMPLKGEEAITRRFEYKSKTLAVRELKKREPKPVVSHGMLHAISFSPTHVHIKSDHVYDLLCVGENEATGEMMATYWDYHGRVWIRSSKEFNEIDRFRELTAHEFAAVKAGISEDFGNHMCLRPEHQDYKGRLGTREYRERFVSSGKHMPTLTDFINKANGGDEGTAI